jgi:Tfp pilus assembly protein FimT
MKRFTIGKLMLWIVIVALATALVVQARQAVIRQNRLRARMEVLTSRYVKELKATQEVLDKAILEKTK